MRSLEITIMSVLFLVAGGSHLMAQQGGAPRLLVEAAYYRPDPTGYAGTLLTLMHNPGRLPLRIAELLLDGQSVGRVRETDAAFLDPKVREEYIRIDNDAVAWYRVYPNPVPPGQTGEVIVRLSKAGATAATHDLKVVADNGTETSATIPAEASAWQLDYIGLGSDLATLHVYVRTEEESVIPTRLHLDGQDSTVDFRRAGPAMHYARIELDRPWQRGSYHAVTVGIGASAQGVLLRALPTPAPVGIMGNHGENNVRQYAGHLFDAHLAFVPGRDVAYDLLAKYDMRGAYIYYRRTKPGEKKNEPVYYNDAEAIGEHRTHPALWAYFLEDEPDGRYHKTDLPRLAIPRDVERANQFCRIFDPLHPVYLQIDHGSYPTNLYIYGQIPDYLCTHAYALGGSGVIEKTWDHVIHTRKASHPRPFYYLNCGYCRRGDSREYTPAEMHLEVYTAVAGGAKSFQWYPAHGDRGLLKHPTMWDAVGAMNGILHQVLPLLAIGTPLAEADVSADGLLSRVILCGDRALIVVLVNRNFSADADAFTLDEVTTDVTVQVPPFIKVRGALVPDFPAATAELPTKMTDSTVGFRASVQAGLMVVLYSDPTVPGEMAATHRSRAEMFDPMTEADQNDRTAE